MQLIQHREVPPDCNHKTSSDVQSACCVLQERSGAFGPTCGAVLWLAVLHTHVSWNQRSHYSRFWQAQRRSTSSGLHLAGSPHLLHLLPCLLPSFSPLGVQHLHLRIPEKTTFILLSPTWQEWLISSGRSHSRHCGVYQKRDWSWLMVLHTQISCQELGQCGIYTDRHIRHFWWSVSWRCKDYGSHLIRGAAQTSSVKWGWEAGQIDTPFFQTAEGCQVLLSLWQPWLLLASAILARGQMSWEQQVKSEKTLMALSWFSLLSLDPFPEPWGLEKAVAIVV